MVHIRRMSSWYRGSQPWRWNW